MKQQVKIKDFADALLKRIKNDETIDCCKEEIEKLAKLIKDKLPEETLEMEWHESL